MRGPLRDGRAKPCYSTKPWMARRGLGWQDEALRGTLRDVRAQLAGSCGFRAVATQPVVPANDAFWMCAAATANKRPAAMISEVTMESPAGLASASARALAARAPTTWQSVSSRGGVGHRKLIRGGRRGCDGHRCRGRWISKTVSRPQAQSDAAKQDCGNLQAGRRGTREKTLPHTTCEEHCQVAKVAVRQDKALPTTSQRLATAGY